MKIQEAIKKMKKKKNATIKGGIMTTILTSLLLINLNYTNVKPIFEQRCSMCHNPAWADKNWMDEKTATANKAKIKDRVFIRKDMPPENSTGITGKEREIIKKWAEKK